jgi:2-haloalkanoic acid dehalogenase type II
MASDLLTKSKVLTFDVYATLIDWESGLFKQLAPLLGRLPRSSPLWSKTLSENKAFLMKCFSEGELALETEHPEMIYSTILAKVFFIIASKLGVEGTDEEAQEFGESVGKWEAYPDTVDALQRLQKFYKLIPLSNCDRKSFNGTLTSTLKEIKFDAIYLAEDIGSYKPDRKNFDYMVNHVKSEFGFEKHEILHTAQSLSHDHVPAKNYGFGPSVWISRGAGKTTMGGDPIDESTFNLGATYTTLGEMADAAEKAFGVKA